MPTWAMLPLATGVSSKVSNSSEMRRPKAASTLLRVTLKEWAGALEWSWVSCSHMSLGNRSGRVAAHWPHLMNAAPAEQPQAPQQGARIKEETSN